MSAPSDIFSRRATPLRPILVGEQMSDMLRAAIVTMHFKPGQRLVVRELEEWSGVSRATIRESLRQLAAEGLIDVIPQRGAVVATPTRQEADEIYEIRALLEGLVGEQFVDRASDQQRVSLYDAFDALCELVNERADAATILHAKSAFYERLLDGANNPTARAVLNGFQARITVLRATTMAQPGRAHEVIGEIKMIVDAVRAHDAVAAGKACSAHVRSARSTALQVLESM